MPASYQPLKLPPGIVRGATPAENPGTWYDGHMVRWNEGVLRPVNGWEQIVLTGATLVGPIRAMHTWTDNSGIVRTGFLCETTAYVLEGNLLIDITPVGGIAGPSGSLTAGGYGEGLYGADTYGTARPSSSHVQFAPPWWSISNWGENLVFMSSYDGRLLQWVPNVVGGSVAAAVAGAPVSNRGFVVTQQRYLILFGLGGNVRRFGWCNQADITNWTFSSTLTTAGFFDVEPSSYIIAAKNTRYGVLMFTSIESYIINYVGTPYIFGYDPLANASVPANAQTIAEYTGRAAWFSGKGFWRFDGSSILPLPCPLLDWVNHNADPVYTNYHMAGVNLGNIPEIWWFFPANNDQENDRCVIWNYKDNWWSKGTVSRTCGENYSYRGYPIMSDGSNVFLHEKGFAYQGSILPFALSGSLNITGGSKIVTAGPMMVDNQESNSDCSYEIIARDHRAGDLGEHTTGPLYPDANGNVDFMISGRDIFLKIAMGAGSQGAWSLGVPQMIQVPRGRI